MTDRVFSSSAGSESEARVQARLAWNGWPDNENSRREIAAHEARDPVSAAAWDRVVSAVTKSAPSLDTSQHAGMLPERELAGGGADTDSHATQAPGDIKEFRACQLHWSEPYGSTIGRAADEIERLSGDAAQSARMRRALETISRVTFSGSEMSDDYMRGNRDAHAFVAEMAREALAAQPPAAPVETDGDLDELQSELTDSLKPQGELRPLCLKAAEAIARLRRHPSSSAGTEDELIAELREHERDYPSLIHGPLCGRAADAIERLRAEPQTAWMPIETAPKDGTVIEIINMDADDPQPFPAHWAQNAGWGDEPAWLIGWPEMWAAGRSAWRATLNAKRNAAACLGILEAPTHWQPRCSVSRPQRGSEILEAAKQKQEAKCSKCGFERREHTYNGACYGICGEFVA